MLELKTYLTLYKENIKMLIFLGITPNFLMKQSKVIFVRVNSFMFRSLGRYNNTFEGFKDVQTYKPAYSWA